MYAPASAGAYKTHSDLMTRIKHLLFALLLAVAVTSPANAFDLPDEDLNYIVLYKWGLINKDAASATLSLRSDGSDYRAQLAASTLPWADKVFRVRDTLQVRIQKSGCLPQVYRKITHEGGTYNRDVVRYSRVGNEVTGHATRVRQKNDGPVMRFDTTLYATGPTFDMLSIFYYLRQFDYPAMSVGSQIHASLFSGKNVEQITVTYRGTQPACGGAPSRGARRHGAGAARAAARGGTYRAGPRSRSPAAPPRTRRRYLARGIRAHR